MEWIMLIALVYGLWKMVCWMDGDGTNREIDPHEATDMSGWGE